MRCGGVSRLLTLGAIGLGVVTGQTLNVQGGSNCYPTDSLVWKSLQGKATVNNQQFHLKGINWSGFEKVHMCLEGLTKKTMDQILDFLVLHEFNAIRLPFSNLFALSPFNSTFCPEWALPEDMLELTSWDILDMLFEKSSERGILILLDMHQLNPHHGFSQLWYDEENPEGAVVEGWSRMLQRYSGYWNLFGLDIKNECHDQCSWGSGDETTDFNLFAQRFVREIGLSFPDWHGLFLVEGIHMHAYGRTPSPWKQWWGGNLFGAEKYPVTTGIRALDDRVAYSPHIYGPDVYNMDYFSDRRFPENLDDVWDNQFGWLSSTLKKAVILGEWGGTCNGKDGITQDRLSKWLVKNCLNDNFWWALNPGSEDTQGMMSDDWSSYDVTKMALLDYVQPDPSKFTYQPNTKTVCMRQGTVPNKQCGKSGQLRAQPVQWEIPSGMWNFGGGNTKSKAEGDDEAN